LQTSFQNTVFQIVHAHGIPDENIVVMMYDDIAGAKENPTPNIIINRPNGPDVRNKHQSHF
jgi:legumain